MSKTQQNDASNDIQTEILDAMDRHADPDHCGGASVGLVIETVLSERRIGVADVCAELRELMHTGRIYQPNDTAIKATAFQHE